MSANSSDGPREAVLLERIALETGSATAALLTLNNPDSLNPLDEATFRAIERLLDECRSDADVRVVMITGAGRAFSAGGDLKKYIEMRKDAIGWQEFLEVGNRVFQQIRLFPKPVICLVNGTAVAGGLELIVSSDFSYASQEARIGDAHVRFGQMGGGGVLTMAPRVLGSARARELIYSGRVLDAATAKEWGIVSEVVPADELLAKGVEFANHVAKWSPLAIANTKFVMSDAVEQGLGAASQMRLELERAALFTLTSEDSAEGLIAFSEKREPKYTGR